MDLFARSLEIRDENAVLLSLDVARDSETIRYAFQLLSSNRSESRDRNLTVCGPLLFFVYNLTIPLTVILPALPRVHRP